MITRKSANGSESSSPRWWRLTIIVVAVLVLCSCRGVPKKDAALLGADGQPCPDGDCGYDLSATGMSGPMGMPGGNTLPPSAWTGPPQPLHQQWAPPGIARPWPQDEYICDGGDRGIEARVARDWTINGLQTEDTIAHYDTLDGRTIVEPSNKVCIYAPRFGSVRRVVGASGYQVKEALVRYDVPVRAQVEADTLVPNSTMQQIQTEGAIAARRPNAQQLNAPGLQLANNFGLIEAQNRFKVHENLRVLRDGVYDQAEEPFLAMRTEAAAIWTIDKGVQIILDGTAAEVATGDARVQATYMVDHDSKPALRIVKVASSCLAQPGHVVDFTLRFDNIGNEEVGNVTIVDNLTTRLEYVPDSQTSTVPAEFLTQTNAGDSLVLRWEITDPLPAGKGGIIRFKCRIR